MLIKDIHIVILIGVFFLTAAVAVWGTIKFAIPNLKDSLVNIIKRLTAIEEKLGASITRADFDNEIRRINESRQQHRISCQGSLQTRIDEMAAALKEFDNKRERARTEIVTKAEFDEHKKNVKADMAVLFKKMDIGQDIVARLDERIKLFLESGRKT